MADDFAVSEHSLFRAQAYARYFRRLVRLPGFLVIFRLFAHSNLFAVNLLAVRAAGAASATLTAAGRLQNIQ
jgi:hypothetical protein